MRFCNYFRLSGGLSGLAVALSILVALLGVFAPFSAQATARGHALGDLTPYLLSGTDLVGYRADYLEITPLGTSVVLHYPLSANYQPPLRRYPPEYLEPSIARRFSVSKGSGAFPSQTIYADSAASLLQKLRAASPYEWFQPTGLLYIADNTPGQVVVFSYEDGDALPETLGRLFLGYEVTTPQNPGKCDEVPAGPISSLSSKYLVDGCPSYTAGDFSKLRAPSVITTDAPSCDSGYTLILKEGREVCELVRPAQTPVLLDGVCPMDSNFTLTSDPDCNLIRGLTSVVPSYGSGVLSALITASGPGQCYRTTYLFNKVGSPTNLTLYVSTGLQEHEFRLKFLRDSGVFTEQVQGSTEPFNRLGYDCDAQPPPPPPPDPETPDPVDPENPYPDPIVPPPPGDGPTDPGGGTTDPGGGTTNPGGGTTNPGGGTTNPGGTPLPGEVPRYEPGDPVGGLAGALGDGPSSGLSDSLNLPVLANSGLAASTVCPSPLVSFTVPLPGGEYEVTDGGLVCQIIDPHAELLRLLSIALGWVAATFIVLRA